MHKSQAGANAIVGKSQIFVFREVAKSEENG